MYFSLLSKTFLICSFLMIGVAVRNGFSQNQPKGKLEGRIINEQGQVLHGVNVVLQPDNKRSISNTAGKFSFTGLYSGTYTLRVSAIGHQAYSQEIEVVSGETRMLDVKLRPGNQELSEVSVNGIHSNPDNFIDMARTAMPSKVITRAEIDAMGSRRLDEVLKEQTGLAMINDIGSGNRAVGLQMQGFDSGYTMIMIDGQPMVGRNNGNFDLSRISVSNIERIEIIKGASSCLFGSDALAGVINIVTRKNITRPQGMAAMRYGSFNMIDATLEGETPFSGNKGSAYLSGNYYRTDGFNANAYLSEGKTAPPFNSYSLQGRSRYLLNDISTLNLNGRFVTRHSKNRIAYEGLAPSLDVLNEYDLNGSVALNNNFSDGTKLKSQYYLTRYQTAQDVTELSSQLTMPGSSFTQYLHRAELQAARQIGAFNLTAGAGGAYELLNNTAYRGRKTMSNYFVYSQADWQAAEKLNLTGGARFDYHDKYGSKLNPSLGIHYQPLKNLTFRAAVGTGFKTPNFQQLYMIFTNVQTGYSVFGADEFWREINVLKNAGQILSLSPTARSIAALRPERSVSYSTGLVYQPVSGLNIDVNVFYNNMKNFINSELVAIKTNQQQIYSYMNIARAYTAGTEIGVNWSATKSISVSSGYQLLYAVDRGVLDSIKNGTGLYGAVYDTDKNEQRTSVRKDYIGLNNRSRHMANVKISYAHQTAGLTGSFRINYRSKYGFMEDNRANLFLDKWDKFVNGFFLFNVSLQKTLYNKHLQLQVTADNLLDYHDQLIPGQPGRAVLAGLSWRFFKND